MSKTLHKSISAMIALVLMFCICMGIAGCMYKNIDSNTAKPLQIVTTFFAPYDFARSIASDYADITMLLKPGAEVHSFEPTPQDLIRIQKADIFIYTGGENDTWVDSILDSMENSPVHVIRMLDLVTLYEEDTMDEDSDEIEWDEHVWTDPMNAALITEVISETCIKLLEEKNMQEYALSIKANTKAYVEELKALDAAFMEVVQNATNKTIVVADRFPFRYFIEAYGLSYLAAFPGCSAESEASASKLAEMITYVREHQIPVIYTIELSNVKMAESICEDTGCVHHTFYSCQNISKKDFEAGETYLSLMRKNVISLKEALNS